MHPQLTKRNVPCKTEAPSQAAACLFSPGKETVGRRWK